MGTKVSAVTGLKTINVYEQNNRLADSKQTTKEQQVLHMIKKHNTALQTQHVDGTLMFGLNHLTFSFSGT